MYRPFPLRVRFYSHMTIVTKIKFGIKVIV